MIELIDHLWQAIFKQMAIPLRDFFFLFKDPIISSDNYAVGPS